MELGKIFGGLILCAVFCFLFFMANRKVIFKSVNWKKASDVVAAVMVYVGATGALWVLYLLVLFAICLIVR